MSKAIRTRIIKIGNSQGVCIPKLLLEQSGIHTEVEIELEGDRLTIRQARHPRAGWDQAFAEMAQNHDDGLVDEFTTNKWDQVKWEW
jgi:antitoxin MazE